MYFNKDRRAGQRSLSHPHGWPISSRQEGGSTHSRYKSPRRPNRQHIAQCWRQRPAFFSNPPPAAPPNRTQLHVPPMEKELIYSVLKGTRFLSFYSFSFRQRTFSASGNALKPAF